MYERLIRRLTALLMLTLAIAARAETAETPAPPHDKDDVSASLLTIGPGNNAINCFGHTAIRMQSRAHHLDYCFTFEMKLDKNERMKFITGQAKAGFMVAQTENFIEQYRRQGRSITEYELNLLPQEKQELWRNLDKELAEGARWTYDFITVNCSSMCVWIIEKSLIGESIRYQHLPDLLNGTYGDIMDSIGTDSPWMTLYFRLRYFGRRNDSGQLNDKMAPELLARAWRNAVFTNDSGEARPVITSTKPLTRQTLTPRPVWPTPMMALIMLIITITILFILTKKRMIMKKVFTTKSNKRLLLGFALVMCSTLSALAGGDDWYAFKVQAEAYPTGAGLVYVDNVAVAEENIQWAATVDREFTTQSTVAYGYAKANEGWQLLGFAKDTFDEENNLVRTYAVTDKIGDSGYALLTLDNGETSKHWDEATGSEVSDDSITVAAKMPLDPNNSFRAFFTHVAAQVNKRQTAMGTVTIDKLVNDIGDKVTLTATPNNEFCQFVNWTLDGQVVSTDPTIVVDVTGIANYEANFSDSRTVTLQFPEAGGYQVFYSNYDFELQEQIDSYSPYLYYTMTNENEMADSVNAEGRRVSHLTGISSNYYLSGKKPAILYGSGEVSISPASGEEAQSDESYSCSLFRWSGEQGVQVDTLPTIDQENDLTFIYYTFDIDKMLFNRITTGTIAPNSLYMRIFGNMVGAGLETPEVIYFNEEVEAEATGVNTVKVSRLQDKGFFTIDGRRLEKPSRSGIYVTDGKKIVIRNK